MNLIKFTCSNKYSQLQKQYGKIPEITINN